MIKKYLFYIALLVGISSIISVNAEAMSLNTSYSGGELKVGNVSLVDVYIDTEGKEINTLEGSVKIDGSVEVVSINTAGSVFTLWPNKPSYGSDGAITFVGGTTDSVFGSRLKVFTVALKPTSKEKILFSFSNLTAYLADGSATSIAFTSEKKILEVGAGIDTPTNELANKILSDRTPPSPFIVLRSRDSSVFDGKYFISFGAQDDETGILRYEVKEGDLPRVRSGTTYVLQKQNVKDDIEVYAIDLAGNERVEKIKGQGAPIWYYIIVIILMVGIIFRVRKFLKK